MQLETSPPNRPKVVHVIVAGEIGGAERFLVNLASRPELSGADHCVALMTPNPELRAFFADAGLSIWDRGPVRENPVATLWRSYGPADISWLGRVLLEERASLIHAHTFGSHILAVRAALRYNLPVVRTEHGVRHYRDPSCALFRQWALRNTARIIAVSAYVARTVAAIAPHAQNKILVIPNGVDMTYFHRAPPPVDGPFTFSVVSRLEPVRRVALAIEAAARTPDVRLNIAGEGSEREKLERLARERGIASRVRFLGYLRDPRPAIAACDAIINCTREEGLGLAVIEAAAMQRPAVVFDGGGIPEIVQDRRTGWLVREHSANALAAALAEASASRPQAAELGVAARNWVEDKFGVDAMCKHYAAVYRELAGGCAISHRTATAPMDE
jgi:glycosyltransferase involved in cell wall biosynthesis